LIAQDYRTAFEHVDVIALPTSPVGAFRIGERVEDPLSMYAADIFTVSVNLAGLPATTVPCGFTSEGLPVGLQLTARAMDDGAALRAGDAFERATTWSRQLPAIAASSSRR
jgi:aspartyl-tRNA(Asn)/glutamyl-tRNA(Gln) amidotransferase subunit A